MRILVTGAAGLLGREVVCTLAAAGHAVRALDRVTPRGIAYLAGQTRRNVTWLSGDLCDVALLERAARDVDAVFHGAAILAPRSERSPAEARRVNVEGTRRLLEVIGAEARRRVGMARHTPCDEGGDAGQPQMAPQAPARTQNTLGGLWPQARPGIIYPSSVALYGPGDPNGAPRGAGDPVTPTDHYTRHKAEAEALVRQSGLPWLILRVGVVVHPGQATPSLEVLRWMFEVRPENRLEILHPTDAAIAVLHALREPRAWQRTLPLGGGRACQLRQKDLLEVALGSVGIAGLPQGVQGAQPFYTDWLDTDESEALLAYQRYTFADFQRETRHRFRWIRVALRPMGPILSAGLAAWVRAGRPSCRDKA